MPHAEGAEFGLSLQPYIRPKASCSASFDGIFLPPETPLLTINHADDLMVHD
jgi:hypothetical protein